MYSDRNKPRERKGKNDNMWKIPYTQNVTKKNPND